MYVYGILQEEEQSTFVKNDLDPSMSLTLSLTQTKEKVSYIQRSLSWPAILPLKQCIKKGGSLLLSRVDQLEIKFFTMMPRTCLICLLFLGATLGE